MDILNKKSLQFELWHECNSKCKFCYLGSNNIKTPVSLKLKAIVDKVNKRVEPILLSFSPPLRLSSNIVPTIPLIC